MLADAGRRPQQASGAPSSTIPLLSVSILALAAIAMHPSAASAQFICEQLGGHVSTLSDTVGTFGSHIPNAESMAERAEAKSDMALEGVAIALAVADPVLTAGDTLGVRVNSEMLFERAADDWQLRGNAVYRA